MVKINKNFSLEDYDFINWRNWNPSRKFSNILHKLTPLEIMLVNLAEPYQDTRDDIGQAELVTVFVLKGSEYIDADREVVIPSAIIHDTGYIIAPNDFRELVKKEKEKPELNRLMRMEHQIIGANHAYQFMKEAEFSPGSINEVMHIILDHDTRLMDTTINGYVMRDSDIMWRFTHTHAKSYLLTEDPEDSILKDRNPSSVFAHMLNDSRIERFHITQIYWKMARAEIANTMFNLFPEESIKLLQAQKFDAELNAVQNFYSKK